MTKPLSSDCQSAHAPASANQNEPPNNNASFSRVSKKVTKHKIATDALDKQTLKRITDFGLPNLVVNGTTVSNFSPPTTRHRAAFKRRIESLAGKPPKPANENCLPHWDHSGERLKFAMAMQTLAGRGCAFTLNLSPRRLSRLNNHPVGFSRAVARYLDRALAAKLGRIPLYCFAVEVTPEGKPHLHGGIASTEVDHFQIDEALKGAGGRDWQPARGGETQVKFSELHYPLGWVEYSLGDEPRARRLLGGRMIVINRELRCQAKATYKAVKAMVDNKCTAHKM